ncbi:MAG: hypothetical protein RL562_3446 [Planctomycetota bacterium]
MTERSPKAVAAAVLILLGLATSLVLWGTTEGPVAPLDVGGTLESGRVSAPSFAGAEGDEPREAALTAAAERAVVEEGRGAGGRVRGVVLDTETLQPIPGVEVRAMREPPGLERLIARFRSAIVDGFFTESAPPPRVLATTRTAGDGTFVLEGIEPGTVFLDGRSDFTFVRAPVQVRIAAGEERDGVELLGTAGGRIRGTVRGPDGAPLPGVVVSARPGINAFLGQLTQRRYRWLEAITDEEGVYDLAGVPSGPGYQLAAAGPDMALEEVYGIDVEEGRETRVDISGYPGATVRGTVLGTDGRPLAGANVALVYLDVSRLLFSADGRAEPITTDQDGQFEIVRLAAGRIGFVAAAEGLMPSEVIDMTVVDGGVYEGVELRTREGGRLVGTVVDDRDRPIRDALVEVRPLERPDDSDLLKMALKVQTVVARSDGDGRFVAAGLSAGRLLVQVSKEGYVTEVRFGMRAEPEPRFVLTRGVTVRGRVQAADGSLITRFSVSARSTPPRDDAEGRAEGEDAPPSTTRGGRRGPGWMRGDGESVGMRLSAGQRLGATEDLGGFQEFQDADGTFTLTGVPPGDIRVRVRAPGFRDPEGQNLSLAAGETGAELTFALDEGAIARGLVVDAATRAPVVGASVSASRARPEARGVFRASIEPEDFDFLGLMQGSRRSAVTDSEGRFELVGLAAGDYRFTARHPDRAKSSTGQDVTVADAAPTEGILIEFSEGGAIEGVVTGAGSRPLADALIVAASVQAGSFKSASSTQEGRYRIEGLAPGQYIVFKSRMDERSANIGIDLLANMRLKSVTVRPGRTARLDVHDAAEGTVRIYGTVRDAGQPVARAMVTALGTDREGVLGIGVRADPTDAEGRFELVGMEPGDYFIQVTRFDGRPQQASLSIEVPDGVASHRVDLDLPQSSIAGRVVDSRGAPVARVQITAGLEDGGADAAPGLLGLVMRNAIAQTRTDEDGMFRLDRVAAGRYRVVASGRGFGRARESGFGQAVVEGVEVDGAFPVDGLVLVLPRAGTITGVVVDGAGQPVGNAEIVASPEGRAASLDPTAEVLDLLGLQAEPVRSGPDGRFTIVGLTPGNYRVRADADGLAPGVADDVVVVEDSATEVRIQVVRGAKLRLRAWNVDGAAIPVGQLTILDGQGRPLASRVSMTSVLRRMFGRGQTNGNSAWYEVGDVPPDTYTVIVGRPSEPEIRVTRAIQDGEVVEWEIDLRATVPGGGR